MDQVFAGGLITAALLNRFANGFAVKTVDQSVNNTTTLTNDNELTLPVNANWKYAWFFHGVTNSNTTADYKCDIALPAGSTFPTNCSTFIGVSAAAGAFAIGLAAGAINGLGGVGADQQLDWWGSFSVGGTSGNATYRFAQATANVSNTFTKIGSFFLLIPVDVP